jgi:hypothetical protein
MLSATLHMHLHDAGKGSHALMQEQQSCFATEPAAGHTLHLLLLQLLQTADDC